MKDYLALRVRVATGPEQAHNLVREYLQARILGVLQQAGAMIPLAFHGGTALRFLYAIPRYSEDLDFALETPGAGYDFRAYLQALRMEFEAEGYVVNFKIHDQKAVHSAFVRFPGLPYSLGLSPHANETFAVKLEVDTNPPAGATLATTVVRRTVPLQLRHHDPASLLAGKLHAILQRPYVKGRDLYDLVWYLSDPAWPAPNLTLLNNALAQSRWPGGAVTPDTWRGLVRARLAGLAWEPIQADVRPFLESPAAAHLLTHENLFRLLG